MEEVIHYTIPVCVENYLFQLETPPILTRNFTRIETIYQEDLDLNIEIVTVL